MSSVEDFAGDLDAELRYEAELDGAESMMAEVFTRRMIETLIDAGEFEEAQDCYWQDDSIRPAVEISGYGITDDTLTLITTISRGLPPERITHSDVQRQIRRARALWERCRTLAYHEDLEESSDAWEMALSIHRAAPEVTRVQVFCVTDGYTTQEFPEPELADGVEHRQATWDIVRLWRLAATGRQAEPVEVDFLERFDAALPALTAPVTSDEYQAYMAVFPGDWLADIYDEFGQRLLERNVRSFLQFTGSTNKGMRDTIRGQPGRFLAYNNGISVTAAEVTLMALPDGGVGIAHIRDLQIVNGGQTTASVHRSMREKVDVARIAVQAKITVVDGPLLDELVPDISKYANTQNKVQQADLSSNDPFHIRVQQLSSSVWAPATSETPRQTRWFYERARGQYQDAVGRESTPARKRNFKDMHPPRQKITKVELATFENTFDQRPHEVSKGAQKNFGDFMTQQAARREKGWEPDAAWWQRAIAKAIIFRGAERIVTAQDFGGYRRNIVTYTIARLAAGTEERLDLRRVFANQQMPAPIADAVEQLSHAAYGVLTDPARPAQNVTEWAKRTACWTQMSQRPFTISPALEDWLLETAEADTVAAPRARSARRAASRPQETEADTRAVEQVAAAGGAYWSHLSAWAKHTGNLKTTDRSILSNLARRLRGGARPTLKETEHAQRILAQATALGFDPSIVADPARDPVAVRRAVNP